jgi:hypothetical protein
MKKIKFNPGLLSGITLILEGDFIRYVSGTNINEQGSIPIKSIKTITVEPGAKNRTMVTFVGEGTSLGGFSTGINYAQKCQAWLIEQLKL